MKGVSKPKQRIRTVTIVLMLLVGLLTPAVRLMLPAPATCGMECCLESGECCCLAELEEHFAEDPDAAPLLTAGSFVKDCSPGCAASAPYSPTFTHKAEASQRCRLIPATIHAQPIAQSVMVRAQGLTASISPRGPPNPFINFIN